MADYVKGLFGGAKASVSSAAPDADFADFATAASPTAVEHAASSVFSDAGATAEAVVRSTAKLTSEGRPYTKWYRIWERTTYSDFYQEMVIIPFLLLSVLVMMWGTSANRKRAKQWMASHMPVLESEFAKVGFGEERKGPEVPDNVFKEKSKFEYTTYCTGRQNVAGLDIKLTLFKRYNPLAWFGETIAAFFFDSFPAPVERVEATAWCFDGREKSLVPAQLQGGSGQSIKDSTFDGFVWAIVHKDKMRSLREGRYDLSLTSTKDHAKLPFWATVMSESAEVTEAMLTPELVKAVEQVGEDLEALVITDQPMDHPRKLDDTVPKKRVSLAMTLESRPASVELFSQFLRLPDHLVNIGHFRPEALRKVKATRDEEIRRLRRLDEDEKAEERRTQSDKLKKEERERRLGRMSADEQRKFLEKERKDQQKKGQKKQTMKG
ncbi:hypothetical protein MBLNU230_g6965t1 [Neophaeotheca triangularis]